MRNSHHSYPYSISFSFRAASKFIMTGFALFLGLTALIGQFASASSSPLIPEDAIRIRIIANSDNESDQTIKYKVRDDVAAFIESWGIMPAAHDEARKLIQAQLPQIQQLVDTKLRDYGASYSGKAELAKVPFPEKMFDGDSYAAGDYEALRITLGEGVGVNWWCVLFPPLCLTAATASDDKASAATAGASQVSSPVHEEPKVKFFLVEMIQKLFAFIASLF